MCGFLFVKAKTPLNQDAVLKAFKYNKYRGADTENTLFYDERTFLGHYRLAIRALQTASEQPVKTYPQNGYMLYNGEIYNTPYLSKFLGKYMPNVGSKLNTSSDTDVLAGLIGSLGFNNTIENIHGMYALAYFANETSKIDLAVDNTGMKPIYYYLDSDLFIASSDIQALRKLVNVSLDQHSIALYLQSGFFQAPHSVYNNIQKLSPGCHLTVDLKHFRACSISKVDKNLDSCCFQDDLDSDLRHIIEQHSISDLSTGVLLSGGIDSTLLAYYLKLLDTPVTCHALAFPGHLGDESDAAEITAHKLSLPFVRHHLAEQDILHSFLNHASLFQEPLADVASVPLSCLVHKASGFDKVLLSGDGADELFCGYPRYLHQVQVARIASKIPLPLRCTSRGLYNYLKSSRLKGLLTSGLPLKVLKLLKAFGSFSNLELNETFSYGAKALLVSDRYSGSCLRPSVMLDTDLSDYMAADQETQLPYCYFAKADRISLFHNSEIRSPFGDYRLRRYSHMTNPYYVSSYHPLLLKKPLRDLLGQAIYDLKHIIDKPKRGFAPPINYWSRTILKNHILDLLHSPKLYSILYLDLAFVKTLTRLHFEEGKDTIHLLWPVIMLSLWLEEFE